MSSRSQSNKKLNITSKPNRREPFSLRKPELDNTLGKFPNPSTMLKKSRTKLAPLVRVGLADRIKQRTDVTETSTSSRRPGELPQPKAKLIGYTRLPPSPYQQKDTFRVKERSQSIESKLKVSPQVKPISVSRSNSRSKLQVGSRTELSNGSLVRIRTPTSASSNRGRFVDNRKLAIMLHVQTPIPELPEDPFVSGYNKTKKVPEPPEQPEPYGQTFVALNPDTREQNSTVNSTNFGEAFGQMDDTDRKQAPSDAENNDKPLIVDNHQSRLLAGSEDEKYLVPHRPFEKETCTQWIETTPVENQQPPGSVGFNYIPFNEQTESEVRDSVEIAPDEDFLNQPSGGDSKEARSPAPMDQRAHEPSSKVLIKTFRGSILGSWDPESPKNSPDHPQECSKIELQQSQRMNFFDLNQNLRRPAPQLKSNFLLGPVGINPSNQVQKPLQILRKVGAPLTPILNLILKQQKSSQSSDSLSLEEVL